MRLDKAQIDAMRRQVEDDFKLDMAAIDRLERRFMGAAASAPAAPSAPAPASSAKLIETLAPSGPAPESRGQEAPDELTGSLRAMFSNYRK
jgi:hypothetical protein